jgi:hypothetical protein
VGKLLLGWLSLGLVLSLSLPGIAQSVPKKLNQGMPWSQARALILEKGWQPRVAILPNDKPTGVTTPAQKNLARTYPELVSCSTLGVEVCQFQFRNKKGKTLQVSTQFSPGFLEPLVSQWQVN